MASEHKHDEGAPERAQPAPEQPNRAPAWGQPGATWAPGGTWGAGFAIDAGCDHAASGPSNALAARADARRVAVAQHRAALAALTTAVHEAPEHAEQVSTGGDEQCT